MSRPALVSLAAVLTVIVLLTAGCPPAKPPQPATGPGPAAGTPPVSVPPPAATSATEQPPTAPPAAKPTPATERPATPAADESVEKAPPPLKAPAKPAEKPKAPTTAGAALSPSQVKAFLVSLQDKQVEAAVGKATASWAAKPPTSAELGKVFSSAAKDPGFNQLVKAHGFKSGEQWLKTAAVVFPAMPHGAAATGSPQLRQLTARTAHIAKALPKPPAAQQKVVDTAMAELAKGK